MTPNQLVENAIDYISSQDFKNLTSQASQSTSDIDSDFTKLTLEGHFPSNLEYIICRGELRNEAKISLALSVWLLVYPQKLLKISQDEALKTEYAEIFKNMQEHSPLIIDVIFEPKQSKLTK